MDGNNNDPVWRPKVLDLDQVPGAFSFKEGFSRPNWQAIRQAIGELVSPESTLDAWADASMQWVLQVREDLGGDYCVRGSKEFILLSELDDSAGQGLLDFVERTLGQIYSVLGDAAWQWGGGKHVILLFSDNDDYDQYVSFFYGEGLHPITGGCLIHKDYVHIAMPYGDGRSIRRALTHELAHNSLVHLCLPLWLNEGIAVVFERTVSDSRRPFLDHELRDRHLAFWNPENIQRFWSGVSWGEPGDLNELSYSLAEIVVNLLLAHKGEFGAFVKLAQRADAGQTAALDCLNRDLGEVMGTFLGEGNWRPQRKAMVECWKAAKWQMPKG
jgi:hypothetical protein